MCDPQRVCHPQIENHCLDVSEGKQVFHSGPGGHQGRGTPPISCTSLSYRCLNLDLRTLLPRSPWPPPLACLLPALGRHLLTATLAQECQRALDPSVIKMSHWPGRWHCAIHCSRSWVCSSQDGSLGCHPRQKQVGMLAMVHRVAMWQSLLCWP